LGVDEDDDLIDPQQAADRGATYSAPQTFEQMILDNLRVAGVQQAHKEDRITFTALFGWPGTHICAEGRYVEADATRRAGVFIGPEFGTVSRPDLVEAAREAGDAGFDVLIACAFNYEAHATEFSKLGRIPVLKARMNADLHMAADLKVTGTANLFVIFGEPDIAMLAGTIGFQFEKPEAQRPRRVERVDKGHYVRERVTIRVGEQAVAAGHTVRRDAPQKRSWRTLSR
jgi:adenine-specific DNA-methyltransferase